MVPINILLKFISFTFSLQHGLFYHVFRLISNRFSAPLIIALNSIFSANKSALI